MGNLTLPGDCRILTAFMDVPATDSGIVLWFTGLSGSGKTTLSVRLRALLAAAGRPVVLLDGDTVREGLCRDLGFSDDDRRENIRRVAEMARIVADHGILCIVALVSPFRAAREAARDIIGAHRFIEIHVCADLTECERRDVKGLYARARKGEVALMTGVASIYEPPEHPDLALDTARVPIDENVQRVQDLLARRGIPCGHGAA